MSHYCKGKHFPAPNKFPSLSYPKGYDDLYSYSFMGPSARIGTASDFVYAFVPHGPKKQLDLFFHAIRCSKSNSFEVRHYGLRSCCIVLGWSWLGQTPQLFLFLSFLLE